jgi:hypothetical protein
MPSSPKQSQPPPGDPGRRQPPWGLPEWFAIAQVAGPAILYLPGTQPFRSLLRIGVFGLGLIGLLSCFRRPQGSERHPSGTLIAIAIGYVSLMILHPATNTFKAGLAQVGLHLAVAAPIFWAPRYFQGDPRRLARILAIIWVSNATSATVGILQVRDPKTWMPAEFSSIVMNGPNGIAMHEYRGPDGRMLIRPTGLGDSPGGACAAGMLVASMGIAYLGLPVSKARKVLGLAGAMIGVTVIFLTHVRSALVVLIGSAIVFLAILLMQKRMGAAMMLAATMVGVGIGSLGYATSLGGQATLDRFTSLVEEDPLTVYDRSARMGMVTGALDTLLVEHPLGAGLGRYGMMRLYFGDEDNLASPSIWAEVQFAAWVLDGGIVLLSLYLAALAVAVRRLLRLSFRHPSFEVRQWAGAVVMLSAAPIALLFSYCPFSAQIGMQFWFLIGAVEGVARGSAGDHPPQEPASNRRTPGTWPRKWAPVLPANFPAGEVNDVASVRS